LHEPFCRPPLGPIFFFPKPRCAAKRTAQTEKQNRPKEEQTEKEEDLFDVPSRPLDNVFDMEAIWLIFGAPFGT
jgi:hypothetical protein